MLGSSDEDAAAADDDDEDEDEGVGSEGWSTVFSEDESDDHDAIEHGRSGRGVDLETEKVEDRGQRKAWEGVRPYEGT